jgi:hypothetical protein
LFGALVAVARAGIVSQPIAYASQPVAYNTVAAHPVQHLSYAQPGKLKICFVVSDPSEIWEKFLLFKVFEYFFLLVSTFLWNFSELLTIFFFLLISKAVVKSYAAQPIAYAAQPLAYHQPALIQKQVVTKSVEDYDHNPQYAFNYDIHDSLTGDVKTQNEQRNGDVVQGSYSLIDADGYKRTVEYTADPVHGFNAVVHREPLNKQIVAKVAQPIAYAAQPAYHQPALVKSVSYAQPTVVKSYAAQPAVAYHQPAVAYHQPAVVKSYAAQPIAYAAQPALVKSYAPTVAYSQPAAYYHH